MDYSFRDIVDKWPSRYAMAADLGVSYWVVSKWHQRNYIEASHWQRLLSAAKARRIKIKATDLVRLAAT